MKNDEVYKKICIKCMRSPEFLCIESLRMSKMAGGGDNKENQKNVRAK
jgi:hypothetical protein